MVYFHFRHNQLSLFIYESIITQVNRVCFDSISAKYNLVQ